MYERFSNASRKTICTGFFLVGCYNEGYSGILKSNKLGAMFLNPTRGLDQVKGPVLRSTGWTGQSDR